MKNPAYLFLGLFFSVILVACGGGGGGSTATDTTPPAVSSTIPVDKATGVAVNSALSATFTEPLGATSITTGRFTLIAENSSVAVSGSITYTGTTATFTPSANLAYSTNFTATITSGVSDLAGNNMAADYVWTFTTGVSPDNVAPTVTSTNPSHTAVDIAASTTVSATFSEPMNATTLNIDNFKLNAASAVEGIVAYVDNTATFTPAAILQYSTSYSATITTDVTDLAGNMMTENHIWTFTTAAKPNIVINEVFGGGGLTAEGYNHDFIELYNKSAFAADLSGWSIQYASAAGSTWIKTNLTGTIPAGGYMLIQEATNNSSIGVVLPEPQIIGTTNMSYANGKVALVSSQISLSSCTSPDIVDFVGYGTANCFDGVAATTPPSTNSIYRSPNGTDTDNNSTDFTSGTATPGAAPW